MSDYNIYNNEISFSFVVNKSPKAIIERLKEVNYLKKDGPFEFMASSYPFACKDQFYNIGTDGSVIEIDDYVAIGSGRNEAIGGLLTSEGCDPVEGISNPLKRVLPMTST